MNTSFETTEEPMEIRLDTHAGLADFAGYVHEQHKSFLADISRLSDNPEFATTIKAGTAAYSELTRYLIQVEELLDEEEMPTQSLVTLIQNSYDEFIRAYEALDEVGETEPEASTGVQDERPSPKIPSQPTAPQSPKKSNQREQTETYTIVTPDFLEAGDNRELIDTHFGSVSAFESAIWRIVREVEKPQKLDSFLGVEHGSIFKEILKEQKVSDLHFFNQQSGSKIREALKTMELEDGVVYDYRIFTEWMKEFMEMQRLVPNHVDLTFAELIAYTMLVPYRVE
jgi:hypothetical protein